MDRHDADERLRKAIIDHAEAYGTSDPDDGELLDQVLVITSWMVPDREDDPDRDDDPRSTYAMQMIGGHMQHHTAIGLCHVTIDALRDQAMGSGD